MFERFLPPRCPVDDPTAAWAMDWYSWLVLRFGRDRALQPMALPEQFAADLLAGPEGLVNVVTRLAPRFGLEPGAFTVEFVDEDEETVFDVPPEDPFSLRLHPSLLSAPALALSMLEHLVCHARLHDQPGVDFGPTPWSQLHVLGTIFFGHGVSTANANLLRSVGTPRRGFHEAEVTGFALALHADMRGELQPPWLRNVRLDVRVQLRRGLRYLRHLHRQRRA